MITRKAILRDVREWFSDPPPAYFDGYGFLGIVVYEHPNKKRKVPRLGVAADQLSKKAWDRWGTGCVMPFTSQPDESWSGAMAVGFATTLDEALALLFPEGLP